MGRPRVAVADRFWSKVDKTEGCWVWTACRGSHGYGVIAVDRRHVLAHRWAYEEVVGLIPPGLVLDHLCRNTLCVRPDHLEAVTQAENMRRGDNPKTKAHVSNVCQRGIHALEGDNVYVRQPREDGIVLRYCKACRRETDRARAAARRGAA